MIVVTGATGELGAEVVKNLLKGSSMRREAPKVVVIGAGAAGLAAANRLAMAGVPVTVLEARARNKGKPTFTTDEVRKQLGLG